MSTFTRWAIEESEALVDDLSQILARLIDDKKRVSDPKAVDALVSVQASVLAARTRAGDMRNHWRSADRNHEHPEVLAPVDHKRAAANDTEDQLAPAP